MECRLKRACVRGKHDSLQAQGLDIFAKDFLFVPIHDHLHWSLLVICHPGATWAPGAPAPCMLHLDSMASAQPASLHARHMQSPHAGNRQNPGNGPNPTL